MQSCNVPFERESVRWAEVVLRCCCSVVERGGERERGRERERERRNEAITQGGHALDAGTGMGAPVPAEDSLRSAEPPQDALLGGESDGRLGASLSLSVCVCPCRCTCVFISSLPRSLSHLDIHPSLSLSSSLLPHPCPSLSMASSENIIYRAGMSTLLSSHSSPDWLFSSYRTRP